MGKIKEGDKVQLLSGSETMTVGYVYSHTSGRLIAKCLWQGANGTIISQDIEVSALIVLA